MEPAQNLQSYEGYTPWESQGDEAGKRGAIYADLHQNHHDPNEAKNRRTAESVLSRLFQYYQPGSILDVGCGLGTWLAAGHRLGAGEIFGIDGPWLDKSLLRIEPERVALSDLEVPFDLGCRFDLVISLEVAEHLSAPRAADFVASLTRHGDLVLFSAAIPHQGGHHHVNEQWPSYWAGLFRRQGYACLDFLRWEIWDQADLYWHIRQNLLLFINTECRDKAAFRPLWEAGAGRISHAAVHPEAYTGMFRVLYQLQEIAQRYETLLNYLSQGGFFKAELQEGELKVDRVNLRRRVA